MHNSHNFQCTCILLNKGPNNQLKRYIPSDWFDITLLFLPLCWQTKGSHTSSFTLLTHGSSNHKATDASSNYTAVYESIFCPPLNCIVAPDKHTHAHTHTSHTCPEIYLIPSRTQWRSWLGHDPMERRINTDAVSRRGEGGVFISIFLHTHMYWKVNKYINVLTS